MRGRIANSHLRANRIAYADCGNRDPRCLLVGANALQIQHADRPRSAEILANRDQFAALEMVKQPANANRRRPAVHPRQFILIRPVATLNAFFIEDFHDCVIAEKEQQTCDDIF